MGNYKLLDCTLRDGGYVNDWEFGHDNMVNIFERLVSAKVDIIEIGFLDDSRPFDVNRSIMPDTKAVDAIFGGLDHGESMIVAMIDMGTCAIEHIDPAAQTQLDGIRVIFKKDKASAAMDYCMQLKDLGYKVFANAVSITSYDDDEMRTLLNMVNELDPFTFSIVDTYGLLHNKETKHYLDLADRYLEPSIGIGFHAHNNFQLAYSNCIEVLESESSHTLVVDGSLYAIGKSAGNAAIELLAMYMNEHKGKKYCINQLLEAIDVTIMDIYRKTPWGYTFKFYIAALHDCHPNYVTYLMDKKKLSVKSVNEILDKIEGDKKLLYDKALIESFYQEYQDIECDDCEDIAHLKELFSDRNVLLLAPGNNITAQRDRIDAYIKDNDPIVISAGFVPHGYAVDYVFLSNVKRYIQLSTLFNKIDIGTIATSNVTKACGNFDYVLRYSSLLDEHAMIVDNPLIMLLRLFSDIKVKSVALAGFDGYTRRTVSDYVNPNMEHTFSKEKALEINADVIQSLARLQTGYPLIYVTDSLYEQGR